jgi:probable rRNA maturation factor
MPEKTSNQQDKLQIEVQNPYNYTHLPSHKKMQQWAEIARQGSTDASVTLRFVNQQEGLALNQTYRSKDGATNILSFVFEQPILPNGVVLDQPLHLGDLVICLPVIEIEAQQQQKSLEQHFAHLIIHGMLHLQGYDHLEAQQAQQMEALEIDILQTLGYPNPYLNS